MPDFTRDSNPQTDQAPSWLISSFAMLIILAATAAVIVGLLQVTSWAECALLLVTGIALSCGVLFTIVTMRRLGGDE
ncbi:MAG TPA: hypothetical protein VLW25_07065 [Bryobacteraceae bacterium]|nr:hypothetical protein [Bryobacteraceae bacterium]